jgi:hypothetical protein
VALWAAFLVLQLAKARRGRCSWGFAAAVVAQALLLAAAAAAYVVFQVRALSLWPRQGPAYHVPSCTDRTRVLPCHMQPGRCSTLPALLCCTPADTSRCAVSAGSCSARVCACSR